MISTFRRREAWHQRALRHVVQERQRNRPPAGQCDSTILRGGVPLFVNMGIRFTVDLYIIPSGND